MKRVVKYLFLFLIIMPILVHASKFSDTVDIANGYYKQFLNPQRYLVENTNKWNLDESGKAVVGTDYGFLKGGLITKMEIDITKRGKSDTSFSYMFDGTKFWAMDKYVIGETIEKKTSNTAEAKTKITEYVKHGTKVTGIGTFENPYMFVDSYSIKITAKGEGKLQYEGEAKTKLLLKEFHLVEVLLFKLFQNQDIDI